MIADATMPGLEGSGAERIAREIAAAANQDLSGLGVEVIQVEILGIRPLQ